MKHLIKSLFSVDGYLAVIPKIQNVYAPEKAATGYEWGFKYDSGVFEFFTLKSLATARIQYEELRQAINAYYSNE